jgi:cytochrome c
MYHYTRILTAALAVALTTILAFTEPAPAATTHDGQVNFNNHCRTCHSMKEGDNRMGPALHDIFGAKAGSVAGYPNYSQGLKSSGITWDEGTLDRFIENPDHVIPNNNMKPFKGVTDPGVREQIISFLKSSAAEEGGESR